MSIEFHCPHCDKYLKTKEDKAGRMADCPGCGQQIEVPSISDFRYQETDAEVTGPIDYGDVDVISEETKPCPMCGQEVKAAAVKCRFCGEEFGPQPLADGEIRPTVIDVGEVMGTSWDIFKANLGSCVGATIVVVMLNIFVQQGIGGVQTLILGDQPGNQMGLLIVIQLIGFLISFAFQTWLTVGQIDFLFELVRGKECRRSRPSLYRWCTVAKRTGRADCVYNHVHDRVCSADCAWDNHRIDDVVARIYLNRRSETVGNGFLINVS